MEDLKERKEEEVERKNGGGDGTHSSRRYVTNHDDGFPVRTVHHAPSVFKKLKIFKEWQIIVFCPLDIFIWVNFY